jgi:enoyl-CoA hydratase/carnithine racemase
MSLIQRRQEGRVCILTLDRPEARNALSAALRQELIARLQAAEADAAVGAIVLTGAGKAFAAGADLKELLARDREAQERFLRPPHIYAVIEGLRKPVLAAVNGHALGAGLELATACDYRVAHASAKLGQPEIRLALIPGGGGTQRLVRLIGHGRASRLVLGGEAIDAAQALAWGLVDEVHADPVARCIELASGMAEQDAEAIATAKRLLRVAVEREYRDGLRAETEAFVDLHDRAEAKQRIKAFLERSS